MKREVRKLLTMLKNEKARHEKLLGKYQETESLLIDYSKEELNRIENKEKEVVTDQAVYRINEILEEALSYGVEVENILSRFGGTMVREITADPVTTSEEVTKEEVTKEEAIKGNVEAVEAIIEPKERRTSCAGPKQYEKIEFQGVDELYKSTTTESFIGKYEGEHFEIGINHEAICWYGENHSKANKLKKILEDAGLISKSRVEYDLPIDNKDGRIYRTKDGKFLGFIVKLFKNGKRNVYCFVYNPDHPKKAVSFCNFEERYSFVKEGYKLGFESRDAKQGKEKYKQVMRLVEAYKEQKRKYDARIGFGDSVAPEVAIDLSEVFADVREECCITGVEKTPNVVAPASSWLTRAHEAHRAGTPPNVVANTTSDPFQDSLPEDDLLDFI